MLEVVMKIGVSFALLRGRSEIRSSQSQQIMARGIDVLQVVGGRNNAVPWFAPNVPAANRSEMF
jgi:hypothetical protein